MSKHRHQAYTEQQEIKGPKIDKCKTSKSENERSYEIRETLMIGIKKTKKTMNNRFLTQDRLKQMQRFYTLKHAPTLILTLDNSITSQVY